jgi:uncharacterized protein
MAILQTERTAVRRLPKRASYDLELIHRVLDEGLICHVAFTVDGAPAVIPTIHTRIGERLYFHGSTASRMLRSLRDGVEACVCVTLLDGLVLARSAFHHSMNYRSAVIFGRASVVSNDDEKRRVLDALVEHVVPGRSAHVRRPSPAEFKQTLVLGLPIEEASAKVRTGGPVDDEDDYALPVWAGVVPLHLQPQEPIADDRLHPGLAVPEYVEHYTRDPSRHGR